MRNNVSKYYCSVCLNFQFCSLCHNKLLKQFLRFALSLFLESESVSISLSSSYNAGLPFGPGSAAELFRIGVNGKGGRVKGVSELRVVSHCHPQFFENCAWGIISIATAFADDKRISPMNAAGYWLHLGKTCVFRSVPTVWCQSRLARNKNELTLVETGFSLTYEWTCTERFFENWAVFWGKFTVKRGWLSHAIKYNTNGTPSSSSGWVTTCS